MQLFCVTDVQPAVAPSPHVPFGKGGLMVLIFFFFKEAFTVSVIFFIQKATTSIIF